MSVRWTSFTKILLLDTWYPIQASSCKIPGVSVYWSIHGFQWHVRVAPWQLCRCRVSRKWSQSIVTLDHILTVAPRSPLRHRCPPWDQGLNTQRYPFDSCLLFGFLSAIIPNTTERSAWSKSDSTKVFVVFVQSKPSFEDTYGLVRFLQYSRWDSTGSMICSSIHCWKLVSLSAFKLASVGPKVDWIRNWALGSFTRGCSRWIQLNEEDVKLRLLPVKGWDLDKFRLRWSSCGCWSACWCCGSWGCKTTSKDTTKVIPCIVAPKTCLSRAKAELLPWYSKHLEDNKSWIHVVFDYPDWCKNIYIYITWNATERRQSICIYHIFCVYIIYECGVNPFRNAFNTRTNL